MFFNAQDQIEAVQWWLKRSSIFTIIIHINVSPVNDCYAVVKNSNMSNMIIFLISITLLVCILF